MVPDRYRQTADEPVAVAHLSLLLAGCCLVAGSAADVLITPEWKLILIDFTRAFRLTPVIKPEEISRCERHLFDALEHLQLDALTHATSGYLTADEAKAVIARRDLIVTHVRKLIAEKGEAAVLY